MTPSMHSRPAGEGEREAVARIADETILKAATEIRESSVAWANDPEEFAHLIELTPAEIRKLILSLLRPAAPDAGGIATQAKIDIARDALTTARQALHQHFVDWDGEPEDALLLQEARSECDLALAALQPGGER